MARFGDLTVGKAAMPAKPSWMEDDEEESSPAHAKPEGPDDTSLMAALEDFSRATKSGDTTGMAKAFRAAFTACEASPHVEMDDDEE